MSDDLYDPFTPKFSAEMFGFFNGLFWVGGGGGGRLEFKRFRCFNKRSFISVLGVGMRREERGSVFESSSLKLPIIRILILVFFSIGRM